jgi:hypothetical protein
MEKNKYEIEQYHPHIPHPLGKLLEKTDQQTEFTSTYLDTKAL